MVPCLVFDAEIRCAVKVRERCPDEQVALKCVCLTLMSLGPMGTGRAKWSARWKGAERLRWLFDRDTPLTRRNI
ncbi:hypothetical protein GCM10009800_41810 [Nocardiopsis rhodophaea]